MEKHTEVNRPFLLLSRADTNKLKGVAILMPLERGKTYMEYMDFSRGMNPLAYIEKLGIFFFLFVQRKYSSDEQYAQNIQRNHH